MKVFTAEEMRDIDRRTAEEAGISTLLLMENAGRAVAGVVMDNLRRAPGKSDRPESFLRNLRREALGPTGDDPATDAAVVVVAGTGNNGGDGFVATRHLADQGVDCGIVLAGPAEKIQGDARANFEAVVRRGIPLYEFREESLEAIEYADVIVDALLGTGVRGALSKDMTSLVRAMNVSGAHIISVDIPSGVNADTGEVCGELPGDAVIADVTVTLGAPKLGMLLYPGADCTGEVIVADIGIPAPLLREAPGRARMIVTADAAADMIPERIPNSHKGLHGHAGIIAGSPGLLGAAAMAGQSCSLAGAGLSTVAVPGGQYPTLAARLSAECMTLPIGEGGIFGPEDVEAAAEAAASWSAVAIGCGLGRDSATTEFVRTLLPRIHKPVVIDADALYALGSDAAEILRECGGRVIITPHPGEMARLLGTDTDWVQSNRLEAAERAADDFGCICVLKGANTIVSEPRGPSHFNLTGNCGLAKGGTGDVLTGIIASFLAQGYGTAPAAICGVWAHGRAADFAAESRARRTIRALDVAEALSDVFKLIEKG